MFTEKPQKQLQNVATKPRLFIASSVEGRDVAYGIQQNLEYDAEVTVWAQGVFRPSAYPLESLVEASRAYDFSAFVFSPDDLIVMRGKEETVVRDNVLFELGLFIGAIGKQRCFIVSPRGETLHFPTDLVGITPLPYEPNRADGNLIAALGPSCNQMRQTIKNLGSHKNPVADQYAPLLAFHDTFRKVNWNSLLERAEKQIDIVVYYFDSWVKAYYDALVGYFKKDDTKMRIFVADPTNPDIVDNVHRLFPEYSKEFIHEKIANTGARMMHALETAGGVPERVEIYYVPHVLNYSMQRIDDSIVVLSIFEMFRELKIDAPAFVLDLQKSDHVKQFWDKEINGLLKVSKRVQVKSKNQQAEK